MAKGKAAKPGEGSRHENAKAIATERPAAKKNVGAGGLPHTYFGNSRSIDTERHGKK